MAALRPRSPLALVVLSLLVEEPMHPYRMQQRIKEQGKDQVANVAQPNSVYQVIDRLWREGLIAVRETCRDEGRPERTVYELTEEGRRTLGVWVRTMLSVPERNFPDFPAALSVMVVLQPDDVRQQLESRAATLAHRLQELDTSESQVPRLFLLEDEYRRVTLQAELDWVRSVIDDLQAGRLAWSEDWIRSVAERLSHGGSDSLEPTRPAGRQLGPDTARRGERRRDRGAHESPP